MKKRKRVIDADLWMEAYQYVSRQLVVMKQTLSQKKMAEVVYKVAAPCQEIRDHDKEGVTRCNRVR